METSKERLKKRCTIKVKESVKAFNCAIKRTERPPAGRNNLNLLNHGNWFLWCNVIGPMGQDFSPAVDNWKITLYFSIIPYQPWSVPSCIRNNEIIIINGGGGRGGADWINGASSPSLSHPSHCLFKRLPVSIQVVMAIAN